MKDVIRHIAVNSVRANGLICKKTYDDLSEIEMKIVFLKKNTKNVIYRCKSTDCFATYHVAPSVMMVPCSICLEGA